MDCIKDEREQPIYSEDVIRCCYRYHCLHNLNKSAAPIINTNMHFKLHKPQGLSMCIMSFCLCKINQCL